VARRTGDYAGAKPLRLFVAVDVPQPVKDELSGRIARFRERIPLARWAPMSNWHVTLKFLGTTWPRLVEEVHRLVGQTAAGSVPIESRLTNLSVFPSPRRARVLWAGMEDPGGALVGLAEALDEALAEDFTPEGRELTPHLTVARLGMPRDISEFAPDWVGMDVASDPFVIDRLVLYRSHLSPKGARYEPLESFPLGG
jgi:RNA 2',3'-cyclic 3'-phosphodiesterase